MISLSDLPTEPCKQWTEFVECEWRSQGNKTPLIPTDIRFSSNDGETINAIIASGHYNDGKEAKGTTLDLHYSYSKDETVAWARELNAVLDEKASRRPSLPVIDKKVIGTK